MQNQIAALPGNPSGVLSEIMLSAPQKQRGAP